MKLLDIVPLQEPNESQFRLDLGALIKRIAKAKGWAKSDGIAIYGHGAGFFLEKARGSAEKEVKALKTEPEEEKEESGAKKRKLVGRDRTHQLG